MAVEMTTEEAAWMYEKLIPAWITAIHEPGVSEDDKSMFAMILFKLSKNDMSPFNFEKRLGCK